MPEPNGGGNGGNREPNGGGKGGSGGSGSGTIEEQQELLADIPVTQFAANPATVQPFQTTTVSYVVGPLPDLLETPVTFSINGQKVGSNLSGSASFAISTDTTFVLSGANLITSKAIATAQATVAASQCISESIAPVVITSLIKTNINKYLSGLPSAPDITVTLSDQTISIQLAITLPSGDGTINVAIDIGVGPVDVAGQSGESVVVNDQGVTVSVHLNTILNVDSFCSDGMQAIAQPLIQIIVDNLVLQAIQGQIIQQISGTISSAQKADPTHRTFVLTTFGLTSEGISYQVCPATPTSPGEGGGPLPGGGGPLPVA
jgi:hypothetical protein